MCVRNVDDQGVLQFTLILAAGCVLHRRTSRVIHRQELCHLSNSRKKTFNVPNTKKRGSCGKGKGERRPSAFYALDRTFTASPPAGYPGDGPLACAGVSLNRLRRTWGALVRERSSRERPAPMALPKLTFPVLCLSVGPAPRPWRPWGWAWHENEASCPPVRGARPPSFSLMILPQVHLRKPCYDFYFL